jgi:hypothetical protein
MKFYSSVGFDEDKFFKLLKTADIKTNGMYYTTYKNGLGLSEKYNWYQSNSLRVYVFSPRNEDYIVQNSPDDPKKLLLVLNNISKFVGRLYLDNKVDGIKCDFLIWPSKARYNVVDVAMALSYYYPEMSILLKGTNNKSRHPHIKFSGDFRDFLESISNK